jgi:hypothetical protein
MIPLFVHRRALSGLLLILAALVATLNIATSLQAGVAYYGNNATHKFHAPSCRDYDCSHCTAVFGGRDQAIKAGFEPCKICKQ